MTYDDVATDVLDAEEADWLDVSYSQRYIEDESAQKIKRKGIKWSKKRTKLAILAVAMCCVLAFGVVLFVNDNLRTTIVTAAKGAYTAIFGEQDVSNTLEIPCNASVIDCNQGTLTLSGGRAALSFAAGEVQEVTENSVVVKVDDTTTISYTNLTQVFVEQGQQLQANQLVGKYEGTFCATVAVDGQIANVVATQNNISWQ
ncbi:MAG: hypothetical protein IJF66_06600 [Clostridia bacterium]|nr:hypothetical protein [Clostridia bacterium]